MSCSETRTLCFKRATLFSNAILEDSLTVFQKGGKMRFWKILSLCSKKAEIFFGLLLLHSINSHFASLIPPSSTKMAGNEKKRKALADATNVDDRKPAARSATTDRFSSTLTTTDRFSSMESPHPRATAIYPASDLLYEEEEKKKEAALKEVNIGLGAPALPSIASNVATGGLLDGPVIHPPADTIFEPIPGSGNAVDLNYLDGLTFVISPPNDPNYRPAQEMIQNFGGSVGINVTKKQVSLAICRSIGNLVAISFIVSNPAFFKTFLSSWQM